MIFLRHRHLQIAEGSQMKLYLRHLRHLRHHRRQLWHLHPRPNFQIRRCFCNQLFHQIACQQFVHYFQSHHHLEIPDLDQLMQQLDLRRLYRHRHRRKQLRNQIENLHQRFLPHCYLVILQHQRKLISKNRQSILFLSSR